MDQKGEWKKFKLEDVLNNPAFSGKTARLGHDIFELKCIRSRSYESHKEVGNGTSEDFPLAFALCT